jgi:RNA polymerase sigma-70 factor, ECF subfamily
LRRRDGAWYRDAVSALSPEERAGLEARVDAAHTAGQPHQAVALLVEGYGPELLSFLAASLPDRDTAADVFSQACEDLLRTFATFRHQCSYRTWVYALARTAMRRHFDDLHVRRREPLVSSLELEAARRTTTAAFLKSEWKDRFRALRDALSPEDRALLVLRVDRDMGWDDIVTVWNEQAAAPVTSAALRKRFERIKLTLREHATTAGWLSS